MRFIKIALMASLVLSLTAFSANAQELEDLDCDIVGAIPGVRAKKGDIFLLRCVDDFHMCHAAVTIGKKGIRLAGSLECDPLPAS